jgi:hypothetical protein
MQYAILCYDSESVVGGWSKERDDAVMAKSLAVKTSLAAKGKMGPTLRLMPTTAATTLRAGVEPIVLDGPYAETKEQLLGFYVVDCEDLNEAIEVAKQFLHGSGALEIRPIKALWQHALGESQRQSIP